MRHLMTQHAQQRPHSERRVVNALDFIFKLKEVNTGSLAAGECRAARHVDRGCAIAPRLLMISCMVVSRAALPRRPAICTTGKSQIAANRVAAAVDLTKVPCVIGTL